MEYFDTLLVFMIGCIAGSLYIKTKIAIRQFDAEVKEIIQANVKKQQVEEVKSNIMMLNHDIVDGIHLFYTVGGGAFAGQGADFNVAATNFKLVYSDKLGLFYNKLDNQPYCFNNGQCIPVSEFK